VSQDASTVQVQALGFGPEKVHLRALAEPGRGLRGVPADRPLRPDLDVPDRRRVEELTDPSVGEQMRYPAATHRLVTQRDADERRRTSSSKSRGSEGDARHDAVCALAGLHNGGQLRFLLAA
jgi:hypothetical protein